MFEKIKDMVCDLHEFGKTRKQPAKFCWYFGWFNLFAVLVHLPLMATDYGTTLAWWIGFGVAGLFGWLSFFAGAMMDI